MTARNIVAQALAQDPDYSYAAIAERAGVSRERVRQIAQRLGAPSRRTPGKENITALEPLRFMVNGTLGCAMCGAAPRVSKTLYCTQCLKLKTLLLQFHSAVRRALDEKRSLSSRIKAAAVAMSFWRRLNLKPREIREFYL